MAKYTAQIITSAGERQTRILEANHEDILKAQLLQEDAYIISLSAEGNKFNWFKKNTFDTVIFVHELKTLLNSGISIAEALEILLDHHKGAIEGNPVHVIRENLHKGLSLSQSMLVCNNIFPPLLIATIAASERNGTIVEALTSYIRYDEQIASLRNKIYNASMYPVLLIGIALIVMLFLLMYLVPRFGVIYEGIDMELPLASMLMLQLGVWLGDYRWYVIGFLILGGLWLIQRVLKQGVESTLISLLSVFSPLRRRLDIVYLSRFYRGMALLLDAGSSAVHAFDMISSLLSPSQQQQLQNAKTLVLQGQGISTSLDLAGLTTPVAARLLAAGDQNGEIVAMLRQSAEFHDLDLSQFIDRFSRLLEPILMLAIGLFIGLIVVLLYMPIFEMAGGIQS